MEFKFFNEKSIARAKVNIAPAGFRYGFIPEVFQESAYQRLMKEFPDVKRFKLVDKMSGGGHKRFYTGPTYVAGKNWGCTCGMRVLPPQWDLLMKECSTQAFMMTLSESTGVQLNTLSTFGLTYGNEGCVQEPHVDGAVRDYDDTPIKSVWTAIVYINEDPEGSSGTCVYLPDRKTILLQAPSMRNGLFFFEQHPEAWHGFPLMPAGAERRILALAYANEKSPLVLKEGWTHQIQCRNFWKSLVGK